MPQLQFTGPSCQQFLPRLSTVSVISALPVIVRSSRCWTSYKLNPRMCEFEFECKIPGDDVGKNLVSEQRNQVDNVGTPKIQICISHVLTAASFLADQS